MIKFFYTVFASALLVHSSAQANAHAHTDIIAFKTFIDTGLFASEMASDSVNFNTSSMYMLTLGAALEHPVPVLPNIMLQADMGGRDISDLNDSYFGFYKQNYILYYELLNNDAIHFDVGAGYSTAQLKLEDQRLTSPSSWISYFNTRVFVDDFFGSFEGVIGFSSRNYIDSQVGLGWRFGQGFDLNLTLHYRVMRLRANADKFFDTGGAVLGLELVI